MGKARYRSYPEPFLSDIMLGPMGGVVQGIANEIQSRAVALAPVETGEYRESITSTIDRSRHFAHGPRAVGVVSAGSDHAIEVEAQYAVMMKAMA